ncbi:hypothetical protein M8C21_024566 [Ambrosia artemisiifolia]|uniref:non-specific serine/threonine protein kinase n=1 Tax=Ambrosia artemisiifolia TaxID=4212 RepID=A0AAD5BV89_AMBAR|nr:hypothetical protein M8C21_024566 [Ambrosia artemisiifolia]
MSDKWFRFAPSFLFAVVVHFAAFSTLTHTNAARNNTTAISDRMALLAIKSMIKDDPEGLMTSWNDSNTNFCQWESVACSRRHQRVTVLDLSSGGLTGMLSPSIGNLSFLRVIRLFNNSFTGEIPPEIGRLFRLRVLDLQNNSFTGNIPATITNCSNLQVLDLRKSLLVGKIPDEIGSLSMLYFLGLQGNILEGGIPPSIANLTLLDTLSLINCQLGGRFLDVFHQLTKLRRLAFVGNNLVEQVYLNDNILTGRLPSNLGSTMPRLVVLSLNENQLTGPLPPSLLGSPQLNILGIADNYLSGKLVITPRNSCNLEKLILSGNSFGSEEDDEMKKLKLLDLQDDQFKGSLPESLGNLSTTLQIMNIASNHFSGGLPSSVGNLTGLTELDLSLNQFTGTLPVTIGNLTNLQRLNLMNNSFSGSIPEGKVSTKGVFANASSISILGNSWLCGGVPELQLPKCQSNKKKNNGIDFQGNDFKAIVYEFMPNGSLDRWLHNPQSDLHQLSLIQRVSIVLDVAYAVDYLHHHAGQTIVHCDIKPSNVLLDEDMVAHVGDFGLSKILQSEYQHRYNSSSAGIRGTIGYAAPEYGVGSKVSKNADMYSYGIMMLEMMTRKKPTDVMFGEELSLHSYAKNAMGDGSLEIVDPVLLKDGQKIGLTTNKEEAAGYMDHERCLRLLLEIGVSCSSEAPQNRMDTASVIQQLQLIKNAIIGNSTV